MRHKQPAQQAHSMTELPDDSTQDKLIHQISCMVLPVRDLPSMLVHTCVPCHAGNNLQRSPALHEMLPA